MRGTRERKQQTKKDANTRIFSRSVKKDKRHLNNYTMHIIIISLYDTFDSIGFIYEYYFDFSSYILHKLCQGSFWRILSAKLEDRVINSNDEKQNKNEISPQPIQRMLS